MSALYLVGAKQGRRAGVRSRNHSTLYSKGIFARLDTRTWSVEVLTEYEDERPSFGSAVKGLSRYERGFVLCAQRRVLLVDVKGNIQDQLTHPLMNDSHHALFHQGALYIASTGADGVVKVEENGGSSFVALGAPKTGELRYQDLRPHLIHPNHLFERDEKLWVSCLHTRACLEVEGDGRFELGRERCHDGLVVDDEVWFTQVDGRLLCVSKTNSRISPPLGTPPMGWCRGLARCDGLIYVGFTRLRATPWRRNLAWLKGAVRKQQFVTSQPTQILAFDERTFEVKGAINLEDYAIDALFGLTT